MAPTGKFAWLRIAAVIGAVGVVIGAFGAHALPGYLEQTGLDDAAIAKRTATFETGVRYHMYHAITLLFVAYVARDHASGALSVACWAFAIGILLFSGFLYGNALTGIKWLGAIVPFGGIAFIVGWSSIAVARWKND